MTEKTSAPESASTGLAAEELQQEVVRSLNLWQRLHLAAHHVSGMEKDIEISAPGMNYRGISHDSVIKSAREVLYQYRLIALSSVVEKHEELFEVVKVYNGEETKKIQHKSSYSIETTFINIDVPTERESVVTCGIGLDGQDKSAGKAQSYGKKYGFMLALQMFTGDGDETRVEEDHGQPYEDSRSQNKPPAPKKASESSLEYLETLLLAAGLDPDVKEKATRYLNTVKIGDKWLQDRVSKTIDRLKTVLDDKIDRNAGEVSEEEEPRID